MWQRMAVMFPRSPIVARARVVATKEQARTMYLASRTAWEADLASKFRGLLRDTYHPITLADGSYWRNSRWHPPAPAPAPEKKPSARYEGSGWISISTSTPPKKTDGR